MKANKSKYVLFSDFVKRSSTKKNHYTGKHCTGQSSEGNKYIKYFLTLKALSSFRKTAKLPDKSPLFLLSIFCSRQSILS